MLHCGDCLDVLPGIADASVDMVCADPPHGRTRNAWDSVIPLRPLWRELRRVLKPGGAVVMIATQPFTTRLIMSNRRWFKYCWVWDKSNPSGYLNAKVMPLQRHEDVVVFAPERTTYRPQMRGGRLRFKGNGINPETSDCYGNHVRQKSLSDQYYPTSIIDITNANRSEKEHSTQKPVALMEYLVRTYTDEGDTVLDFCMGSGTTGVACERTGRLFVGIERDPDYFAVAQKRLAAARAETPLFPEAV